ncbi:MAG: tetraacyldisaccharide 4'-kinase [Flavobacteriaceae bacterium]
MKILRLMLFPFSILFGISIWFRNLLFDLHILKNNQIPIPSIGVGNLSTGGTGKTVVIDYLINLLKDQYSIGMLSRGYKRETSGVVLANKSSRVQQIGDEPYQLLKKHPEIQVVVAEKRILGIQKFLGLSKPPDVVLLDDIMQHRYVVPDLLIMTTTYQNPYFSDFLLPSGNLREPRAGSKRANILLVTKCPATLDQDQKNSFLKRVRFSSNQHIFFTKIKYGNYLTNGVHKIALNQVKNPFLLVTGIANSMPLVKFLKGLKYDFTHLKFSDHHSFSPDDRMKIKERIGKGMILTTEKDFTRLEPLLGKKNIYYLPIEMGFVNSEDQKHFDQFIQKQMELF